MVGLDIGGTKTELAVFDNGLNRVFTRRTATPAHDYDGLLRMIGTEVATADARFGTPAAIGAGVPGIVDRRGRSFSVNVPCLNGHDVRADLSRTLNRNVAVINDGRAFALSEANGGAADGYRCMIGVILGTGAFGGYCIDGRVQAGRDGIAGEWGHLPIAATVRERHGLPLYRCGCGADGCIECYISGPGLSRLHWLQAGTNSAETRLAETHLSDTSPTETRLAEAHLSDTSPERIRLADAPLAETHPAGAHPAGARLSARAVVEGMRTGEPVCVRAFDIWMDCVASCVAQLVLHINPDIIVIGGGLSRIAELYTRLPKALSDCVFEAIESPAIVPAEHGDASGVRGAAIVAAQRHGWSGA